jgi:hypothetical protein
MFVNALITENVFISILITHCMFYIYKTLTSWLIICRKPRKSDGNMLGVIVWFTFNKDAILTKLYFKKSWSSLFPKRKK